MRTFECGLLVACLVLQTGCAGEVPEHQQLEHALKRQHEKFDAKDKGWHSGGSLHHATVAQWRAATTGNRLATAGDFASKPLMEKPDAPRTAEQVRPFADALMRCIDETATHAPRGQPVSELSAGCVARIDWHGAGPARTGTTRG